MVVPECSVTSHLYQPRNKFEWVLMRTPVTRFKYLKLFTTLQSERAGVAPPSASVCKHHREIPARAHYCVALTEQGNQHRIFPVYACSWESRICPQRTSHTLYVRKVFFYGNNKKTIIRTPADTWSGDAVERYIYQTGLHKRKNTWFALLVKWVNIRGSL